MFGLYGDSIAVVNVRSVDGVDVEKLELQKVDGKNVDP